MTYPVSIQKAHFLLLKVESYVKNYVIFISNIKWQVSVLGNIMAVKQYIWYLIYKSTNTIFLEVLENYYKL